jgi:hypothetical protein
MAGERNLPQAPFEPTRPLLLGPPRSRSDAMEMTTRLEPIEHPQSWMLKIAGKLHSEA